MSSRLRNNNPNICDLSDKFRPTKLAEVSSELYDNEWTNAFDNLTEEQKMSDTNAIRILLDVVLVSAHRSIWCICNTTHMYLTL